MEAFSARRFVWSAISEIDRDDPRDPLRSSRNEVDSLDYLVDCSRPVLGVRHRTADKLRYLLQARGYAFDGMLYLCHGADAVFDGGCLVPRILAHLVDARGELLHRG